MPILLIAARLYRRVRERRILLLLLTAAVIVLVGGVVFAACDHVGVGTGIYWSVTTATTVGYGDVTPHNTASRVVAICVMLTTIPILGSVFALLAGAAVVARLRRLLGLEAKLPSTGYTVVYGSHTIVPQVISELAAVDDPVVLVAPAKPVGLQDGVHFLLGDPTDEAVLHSSEPHRANRALIACTDDADTLIVAVTLRNCAPDLEVYALSESPRVAMALRDLGITHTLSTTRLVSHTVAKALESPAAGEVVLQLVDSPDYVMRERTVDATMAGRALSTIRTETGALVLALRHDAEVDLGVVDDPVVAAGDSLIELVPRRKT
jgi:voltage-gated potassium channel